MKKILSQQQSVTVHLAVLPLKVRAVIVAVPAPTAVTTPPASTVATPALSVLYWMADADFLESAGFTAAVCDTWSVSALGERVILEGAFLTVTETLAFRPLWVLTVTVVLPAFFPLMTPFWETLAIFLFFTD